ncbi:MAG: hypothetical protein ACFFAY_05375 [Promethearchaeota archaeon]
MSRRGKYGDPTQRCAYCGKPEVSWIWSISSPFRNVHYCSLECSARDNQYGNLGCTLCLLPMTAIFSVGIANSLISEIQIRWEFIVIYGIVLLLQILMVYQVYIGRK